MPLDDESLNRQLGLANELDRLMNHGGIRRSKSIAWIWTLALTICNFGEWALSPPVVINEFAKRYREASSRRSRSSSEVDLAPWSCWSRSAVGPLESRG